MIVLASLAAAGLVAVHFDVLLDRLPDSVRPLCIGMAHGLAGSAALMLMILATTTDVTSGLLSILLFGIGSSMSMIMIGLTISVPVINSRSINQRLFMGVQGDGQFCQRFGWPLDVGYVGIVGYGALSFERT